MYIACMANLNMTCAADTCTCIHRKVSCWTAMKYMLNRRKLWVSCMFLNQEAWIRFILSIKQFGAICKLLPPSPPFISIMKTQTSNHLMVCLLGLWILEAGIWAEVEWHNYFGMGTTKGRIQSQRWGLVKFGNNYIQMLWSGCLGLHLEMLRGFVDVKE